GIPMDTAVRLKKRNGRQGRQTPGTPSTKPLPSELSATGATRPRIAYSDLREWIKEADKLGEVREVEGLTWQDDIGIATELLQQDDNSPCVIFNKVPGSLPGSRVLVNFFAGRRQNMTLGFPVELTKLEATEAMRVHYMNDLKRIPPKYVSDGPVFEN